MGRPKLYPTVTERVAAWRLNHPGFGMTPEAVASLMEAQGGVCAICGRTETAGHGRRNPQRLAIDHDHATDSVRGLLCYQCNTALALMSDEPARLRRAADYLESDKDWRPAGGKS